MRKIIDCCISGTSPSKQIYYKKGVIRFANENSSTRVGGQLSILPRAIILKIFSLLRDKDHQKIRLTCKYLHYLVNSILTVHPTSNFYCVEFSQATIIDSPGFPPQRNKLTNICTSSTCTNLSTILYFVDLSSFDLTTKDIWNVSFSNSLKETFSFFIQLLEIISYDTRIVMYFTKADLLKKKIKQGSNLLICPLFSEMNEKIPVDFEETLNCIVEQFRFVAGRNRNIQTFVVMMDELNNEEILFEITKYAKLDVSTLKLGVIHI